MYMYEQKGMIEELEAANIMDCMECGACAYICPGRLHLTQTFKTGKQKVKDAVAKRKAAAGPLRLPRLRRRRHKRND